MTFGSWEDTVMVMMTNKGEVDLLENLLCSLRMVGINKYLTFATGAHLEPQVAAFLFATSHTSIWRLGSSRKRVGTLASDGS